MLARADGSAEAQGDLQSVVLHDLTLKHAKSSFPTSVGAHIFGVDASAFASSGEAFSTVLAPNSDRAYERSLQKDPVQMAYSFSTKVRMRLPRRLRVASSYICLFVVSQFPGVSPLLQTRRFFLLLLELPPQHRGMLSFSSQLILPISL